MDVATLSDIIKEVSKRTGLPVKVVKSNVEVMLRILEEDMRSPDKFFVSLPFLGRIIATRVGLKYHIDRKVGSMSPEKMDILKAKMENINKAIDDDSVSFIVRKIMRYRILPRRHKYRGKFKFNDYKSNEKYQNELADRLNERRKD